MRVQKYIIAEGPLYEVRGGEGGNLAIFDCYVVAQTEQGQFISETLVVKGDGGYTEDGFRIPNTNYQADCFELLESLKRQTEIDITKGWQALPPLPTLEQSLEAEAVIEHAQRYGFSEPDYPYWLYTLKEDMFIVPHTQEEDDARALELEQRAMMGGGLSDADRNFLSRYNE